jgi:threonine/homoserine/homoserine lactone efflux protein
VTDGVLAAAWEPVGRLVLTALAIMGSPGPATISLVAAGSAYGARRSLGYLVGIVGGTAVVLLAVASGITAALLAVSLLRVILLVVSAAYILWLAWHIAAAPPQAAGAAATRPPSLAAGFGLAVANPKAWVAIAAVFAAVRVAHGLAADAALKIAVLTALIVVINTTWLLAGASLAPLLRDPRRSRIVNVTLAVALVASTTLVFL